MSPHAQAFLAALAATIIAASHAMHAMHASGVLPTIGWSLAGWFCLSAAGLCVWLRGVAVEARR